jgi:hypothetical protein
MFPGTQHDRRLGATWRRVVRDEEGIALVLAILIMLVLTIMLTAVIYITAAAARDAHRTNAGQKAYALAESGINNALAVLNGSYTITASNPDGVDFFTPATPPKIEPTTLLPERTNTYPEGTVKWRGTYCMGTVTADCGANDYGLWKLVAIGSVRNPTGPGAADVTRTVRAKVQASRAPSTQEASGLWDWVYSGDPATDETTCNMTIDGSVKVLSPIYAAGNLCLNGQAKIIEPGTGQQDRLVVGGRFFLKNSAGNFAGCVDLNGNQVGSCMSGPSSLSSLFRLREVHIVNGCVAKADSNNTLREPCRGPQTTTGNAAEDGIPDGTSSVFVRPGNFTVGSPGGFSSALPDPPVSAPVLAPSTPYNRAHPGPLHPCVTASTDNAVLNTVAPPVFDNDGVLGLLPYGSVSTVQDLTPASKSYQCSTVAGELSWNHLTRVLTVRGTLYIDGSASIGGGSGVARYDGRGAIFVSGTFVIKNISICAKKNDAGDDCAWDGLNAWNPNDGSQSALTIAAFGKNGPGSGPEDQVQSGNAIELQSARFQGLLYANYDVDLGSSSSTRHQGPVVTHSAFFPSNNTDINFPPMSIVPTDTPGEPDPPTLLGPVIDYAG